MMNIIFSYCDVPEEWQMTFQDPATPQAEGMIAFHNSLMFYCVLVGFFVFTILTFTLVFFKKSDLATAKINKFTHSSELEIIWTIIPAVILLFIAVPSFALLYSLEDERAPFTILKVIGHQWYWSYEITTINAELWSMQELVSFDSYIVKTNDIRFKGEFRLLEVDNRIILPTELRIRVLVTSADVLHSWAVPSFGVKIDACPGRLSQAAFFIKRPGIYYGQCSEICGINHGFMPITIRATPLSVYSLWIGCQDVQAMGFLRLKSRIV